MACKQFWASFPAKRCKRNAPQRKKMMKLLNFSNRAIEYLFYALFFLVPIVFLSNTSELFEFNKMWVTYGIAILIGFFWILKIVITKQIRIRRTPLDIPILLFLLAHLISTVISWDPYVSFWGYYSRFNGGTLSILTYAFLYFAFASNVIGVEEKKDLSNFPKFLITLSNNLEWFFKKMTTVLQDT